MVYAINLCRFPRTSQGTPNKLDKDGGNDHRSSSCYHSTHGAIEHPHRLRVGDPRDASDHDTDSVSNGVQLSGCISLASPPRMAKASKRSDNDALGPRSFGRCGGGTKKPTD
jgi:hypothetical protein